MNYRLMTLAVMTALAAGCANHDVRDKLMIQDPTVADTPLAPQSTQAGALNRNKLIERAGQTPEQGNSGATDDPWMNTYGRFMYSRSDGLDGLQLRMDKLGDKAANYDGAKAQCWIDAGRAEQSERNGWGFVEEAMGEADRLSTGLAEGRRWMGNSTLRTSVTVRPDLWASLDKTKADPRFPHCPPAQRRVACQEVNLMWAGHNAWARSFESAQKKVANVEGQMQLAQADLAACAVPAQPAPLTPVVQTAPRVLPPVINLGADTLFKFDKADAADMLPEGRAKLDVLAETLQKVQTVKSLTIVGHTDRLGTVPYNAKLSQRRADTVMAYLRARGVTQPMGAQGVGSGSPLVQCPGPAGNAVKACLQPNRRVEIRVEQARE